MPITTTITITLAFAAALAVNAHWFCNPYGKAR